MMNIDVTALQAMPELAGAPGGLKPKKCLTATDVKCAYKSCEITKAVVS